MTVSFRHFGFVAGPTPTERERRPVHRQLSSGDVNLSPFHFLHAEEQTWYFKLRFPRLIMLAARCIWACPITGYMANVRRIGAFDYEDEVFRINRTLWRAHLFYPLGFVSPEDEFPRC